MLQLQKCNEVVIKTCGNEFVKNGDCVLLAVTVKTVENGDDCDDAQGLFIEDQGQKAREIRLCRGEWGTMLSCQLIENVCQRFLITLSIRTQSLYFEIGIVLSNYYESGKENS